MGNYRNVINPFTGKLQRVLSDEYIGALGVGDMLKSVYDIDENGIVDNSEKLEGSTKAEVQDHTPKAHFHVEGDITDLDHDALKIQGIPVDAPLTGDDGEFLSYNASLGKYEWKSSTIGAHTHNEVDILDLDHYDSADFSTDFGSADLVNLSGKSYNDLTDKPDLTDLHTHSNKSELDLVTDGDHDVRTDDPHNVQASQVSFSATGFTAVNVDDAITELDSEKAPTAHTHVEANITDLDHYDSTDFDTDFATKNIADLADVIFDTGTPTNGQVLTYNSASGKWKAETPTGGTGYWELDGSSDLMPTTTTRDVVPRADGEGSIGTTAKRWLSAFLNWLDISQYIDFTNSSNPAHSEGRVFYDQTEHALAVYNENSEVTHQLGQEFLVRVRNETGDDILDGSVVKIVGATGDIPLVGLAQADTLANAEGSLGIATCDIVNNGYGYVTTSGKIHNLNTGAFNAGDKLYLSDTVAGGITKVRPNISVVVGYCVESDTSAGSIMVIINNLIEITIVAGITYLENETESTTTDDINWTRKLRMTFTPPAPGDYWFHWSAEVANSGANKGTYLRLMLDEATGAAGTEINASLNAPIVANGYLNVDGFKKITFADTNAHTLDIDFKAETSTSTAKIRRARLAIRKT